MTDVFTKEKRSWLMARVLPRRNRSTEMRFVTILREKKISGWRRGYPLFGKPDFVFLKARIAIFIDGCFWHGCPHHKPLPESNRNFWITKIEKNINRDKQVNRELRRRGWRVMRFWEHDLNNRRAIGRKLRKLISFLQSRTSAHGNSPHPDHADRYFSLPD